MQLREGQMANTGQFAWTIAKVVADKTEWMQSYFYPWCHISNGKLPSLMFHFRLRAILGSSFQTEPVSPFLPGSQIL